MRNAGLVKIFACLAFGFVLSGQVPADVPFCSYDIGLVAQVPNDKADVLVVYKADWCGPCRAYAPTVEAIRKAGFKVVVVDTDNKDKAPAEFRNFKYKYVPTTFFYNSRTKTVVRTKVGKLTRLDILSTLWKQ